MRVLKLLKHLEEARSKLAQTEFLAPCVKSGRVRVRIDGLIYDFQISPRDFTGWGIFMPANEREAKLIRKASTANVGNYLRLFPAFRMRLSIQLDKSTWLAYPTNESDARQRLGSAQPMLVRLVDGGAQFDQVVGRWDGAALWFEELDRKESPRVAERLRSALAARLKEPVFTGLTPEMRACYTIAFTRQEQEREKTDEERLRDALGLAGGSLESFIDMGDYWNVSWQTSDGIEHTSAILKTDMTVLSSGVCLSDRDSDFDLQSLVRVIEIYDQW